MTVLVVLLEVQYHSRCFLQMALSWHGLIILSSVWADTIQPRIKTQTCTIGQVPTASCISLTNASHLRSPRSPQLQSSKRNAMSLDEDNWDCLILVYTRENGIKITKGLAFFRLRRSWQAALDPWCPFALSLFVWAVSAYVKRHFRSCIAVRLMQCRTALQQSACISVNTLSCCVFINWSSLTHLTRFTYSNFVFLINLSWVNWRHCAWAEHETVAVCLTNRIIFRTFAPVSFYLGSFDVKYL